ncbi:hypothetical protein FJT64_017835 [Amphibalanus amphitrite]|uniref:Uncharacterized protein n=1 Tax=Amphibalanus amphitrite TaxID=1232801 RepID=A0A6A4XAE6_AMPAM|nr:hypothetical protein FJT64_017835 [Amphibalanus amphitrite]
MATCTYQNSFKDCCLVSRLSTDFVLQEHTLQRTYRQQITAPLREAGLAVGPTSSTPDWRYIACVPAMVHRVEHTLQCTYRQQLTALLREAGLAVGPTSSTPDRQYIACVPAMVHRVSSASTVIDYLCQNNPVKS